MSHFCKDKVKICQRCIILAKITAKCSLFVSFMPFLVSPSGMMHINKANPVSWLLQLPGLAFEIKRLISEKMN
ncbi:hypothetical protein ACU52_02500 [Xylanibacter rarus]|uniref:Uncharacterized protein n=1 Tax=Xylanibacter rarus TaxID=1676614 RepID=A0A8E1USW9_9BACT|nr:hypothetical protein ACU52_02500 [Xylanibacter rarus]